MWDSHVTGEVKELSAMLFSDFLSWMYMLDGQTWGQHLSMEKVQVAFPL